MPVFNDIIDFVMRSPDLSDLRPVVEKELLHYEILFALDQRGLLENLTFQGGTSLRLCHNSPRFSEDLDFVGGSAFAPAQLMEIGDCVEKHIASKYDLKINIKSPSQMRKDPTYYGLRTDRWQISVMTRPGRPDLPCQKIKLEVANVPAHTSELRPLSRNYHALPDGYEDMIVRVETLDEIMADKIVSLAACTTYKRHRDIWDIQWLKGKKGASIRADLIEKKVEDYGISDYKSLLEDRIESIIEVVNNRAFSSEMSRFITPSVRRTTFDRPGFTEFLGRSIHETLSEAYEDLYNPAPEPEFDMG